MIDPVLIDDFPCKTENVRIFVINGYPYPVGIRESIGFHPGKILDEPPAQDSYQWIVDAERMCIAVCINNRFAELQCQCLEFRQEIIETGAAPVLRS